ncbi:PAS domain-containing sensor histidine kinase [Natranaeroarchaeum sulfidigenes]|uniref:histidine kinase n=1 Tax=Natranaeroarchaeum sulfidigenes TaxID=2784880 RepID=A0A897MUV9_9EURY|nr:PAS domain-containing protein [Natranaeroarchaeum sulfidigenes]QSG04294.1 Signal transduction regulator [Natranaeroarchaeum sulfidigenes]
MTIRHVDSISVPESADPDCIVVPDCSDVDGIEAVRRVSDNVGSATVVAVAVDASDGFARTAKRSGADDVICLPSKDWTDDTFVDLVAERLLHAAGEIEPFADEAVLLDDLLDNIPHRVFVKNEYGQFAAVSEAKSDHYGLSREELIGLTDFELAPDIGMDLRQEEVAIMETGEPIVNKVEEYTDDDGRRRWVSTTKAPRRDDGGEVVGIVGSTRDVTEQRRHEKMLNTVHTASRRLVASESRDEIVDVATEIPTAVPDMPTVVLAISDAGGELSFETAPGAGIDSFAQCTSTLEASSELREAVAVEATEEPRPYDTVDELDTPACVAFPLGHHGALGVVDTGEGIDESAVELAEVFAANVRTALDSAARKERLSNQNERLEEFAGIVSHDLRNPLSVAQGYLELLDADPEIVGEIEAALDRIDRMSDDLLTLARDGEIVGEVGPESIADAAALAWDTLDTAEATLVVEDDVGSINADRDRLLELLENLFSNAVEHGSTNPASQAQQDAVEHSYANPASHAQQDAVEHGSTSPDSYTPQEAEARDASSPASQAQQDATQHNLGDTEHVRITVGGLEDGFYVADDGIGIPDDEKEDVFDRGYTTHEDGTGFGLRIVEVIASAHGWEVDLVDSESGGARFEIRTR